MCIIVECIRIDICIIHACIRIKDHGYVCMYQDQGSEIYMHLTHMHASGSRSRIIYVHHTHMHQSQGSRITNMCIIHTCIRVKDRGTLINASYRHVTFFILFSMGGAAAGVCIIHSSTRIHASCMYQDQGQGSQLCASYICASNIHQGQRSWICVSYIHLSYMHQGDGRRIIYIIHTRIIHTCISVKR